MSHRAASFAFGVLVAAYLLVDAVCVALLAVFGTYWGDVAVGLFISLVGSQMLLLGIWTGLSNQSWVLKLIGLMLGLGWLIFVSQATETHGIHEGLLGLVTLPVLLVTIGLAGCRRFFVLLEHRSEWPQRTIGEELRFSSRTLIALTITVSMLLALGRLFRESAIHAPSLEVPILIIMLLFILGTATLLWGCLGEGRAIARIPFMLLAVVGLGLVFPYYSGRDGKHYVMWLGVTAATAVLTGGSLLVARWAGYRVVRGPRTILQTGNSESLA
jgi:hypothetical protein